MTSFSSSKLSVAAATACATVVLATCSSLVGMLNVGELAGPSLGLQDEGAKGTKCAADPSVFKARNDFGYRTFKQKPPADRRAMGRAHTAQMRSLGVQNVDSWHISVLKCDVESLQLASDHLAVSLDERRCSTAYCDAEVAFKITVGACDEFHLSCQIQEHFPEDRR